MISDEKAQEKLDETTNMLNMIIKIFAQPPTMVS